MTGRREVTVHPSRIDGAFTPPPSKSYTHRALIAAYLTRRRSIVRRPLDSEDTRATLAGIRALGRRVRVQPQAWKIEPGPKRRSGRITIDCRESGTTLRLLSAVAAAGGEAVHLVGRPTLARRPTGPLYDALAALGADVRRPSDGRSVPVRIEGPLRPGAVRLDGSSSSQFVSAMLFVLPTLDGSSRMTLDGPLVSQPYVDATRAVLHTHGVRVDRRGRTFHIPGGQRYAARSFTVPPDASSAAYPFAAAALSGGAVRARGLTAELPQADLAIVDVLARAGASTDRRPTGLSVQGPIDRPFRVDLTNAPDLYPLCGAVAACLPGTSRIDGARHVVGKESDRFRTTVELARALGARVAGRPGRLYVTGQRPPTAIRTAGLRDHRVMMSAAVAAVVADGPSRLADAQCVRKSWPGFWATMRSLGGAIRGAGA